MYIGPFYFDTKELFLVILTVLLGVAMYLGWDPTWFSAKDMLTLTIVVLFTKGLLPAIHNEAFFFLAVAAIFLTLYIPIFQVILFYFVSFIIFRIFKVI